MTVGLLSFAASPPVLYPGQPGFEVGYAATPAVAPASFAAAGGQTWPGAYPGSLTAWPGGTGLQTISSGANAQSGAGTVGDPYVFAFYDFDGLTTTGGTNIALSNCIFVGCRFQSNSLLNYCVNLQGSGGTNNVSFIYCSTVPRVALSATPTHWGTTWAWPSDGAGHSYAEFSFMGTSYDQCPYAIPGNNGHEFAFNIQSGANVAYIDRCDSWGCGNWITWNGATTGLGTSRVTKNWCHDFCNSNSSGHSQTTSDNYHIDGPGYLQGSGGPNNIIIDGNTIAGMGQNNPIAFQANTSTYDNIQITNNFISSGGNCFVIALGAASTVNNSCTNQIVTGNVFSTVLPPMFTWGADYSTLFNGTIPSNHWSNNKLQVWSGTTPVSGWMGASWTSADDGKFMWPDWSYHTVDF